jgi:hypothetical protein
MSIANIGLSTGAKTMLLSTGSLNSIFTTGCIWVFSGARPASPDDATTGTLVGQITTSGGAWVAGASTNGLLFESPAVLGVLSKKTSDTWKMVGKSIGNAGYARFVGNATDAGGASTSLPRMDFDVGTTSGVLQLTSTATTVGSLTTVDTFTIALATQ